MTALIPLIAECGSTVPHWGPGLTDAQLIALRAAPGATALAAGGRMAAAHLCEAGAAGAARLLHYPCAEPLDLRQWLSLTLQAAAQLELAAIGFGGPAPCVLARLLTAALRAEAGAPSEQPHLAAPAAEPGGAGLVHLIDAGPGPAVWHQFGSTVERPGLDALLRAGGPPEIFQPLHDLPDAAFTAASPIAPAAEPPHLVTTAEAAVWALRAQGLL